MKLPPVGQYQVRHPLRATPFMLSVIRDSTGALPGVLGYEIGEPVPSHGRHLMLIPPVRLWLEELAMSGDAEPEPESRPEARERIAAVCFAPPPPC